MVRKVDDNRMGFYNQVRKHVNDVCAITIDLVLIDQQSVGKRSLHLMKTVNAKKRWTTIY
jgi:hypothetical protein